MPKTDAPEKNAPHSDNLDANDKIAAGLSKLVRAGFEDFYPDEEIAVTTEEPVIESTAAEPEPDGEVAVTTVEPEPEEVEEEQEETKPASEIPSAIKKKRKSAHETALEAAELMAEKIVEKLDRKPSSESAPIPTEQVEIPAEYQDEYAIAKFMDENGKAGVAKKYVEFIQAEQAYKAKWEKVNKGQRFDKSDSEHDTFYEDNPEPWTPQEYRRAEIRVEAKRIAEQELAPLRQQQREEQKKVILKNLEESRQKTRVSMFQSILGTFDDAYAAQAATQEGFSAVEAQDPIAAEAAQQAAGAVMPVADEIINIYQSNGMVEFSAENPTHQIILQLTQEIQDQVMKLPAAQRVHEGKQFARMEDLASIPQDKLGQYWWVDQDVLLYRVQNDAKQIAQKIAAQERDREKKILERHGKAPAKATSKPAPTPVAPAPQPKSPSASSGAKVDTLKLSQPSAQDTWQKSLAKASCW